MKKLFLIVLMTSATAASAQTKTTSKTPSKTPAKTPAKTVTQVKPLKTLNDSASYAIGLSVANFYAQQGMTNLNVAMIAKACSDVLNKKTTLLSDYEANNVIMAYMNKVQSSKAQPTIAAGEKFLAQNKTKPGVKTTASGLQYEVMVQGTGPKPTAADTVVVNYAGTLIDGTEFDNSYKRGQPITFPVGGVIKGWTEALQLMPAGSKYKLYIPHELAYGTNDVGTIPAGSVLVFEVELLKVVGKE